MKIIKNFNTDNHTFIKGAGKLSEKVPISTGIRQADSLSPALFNIKMEEIITVKKAGNLERLLSKFERMASRLNMRIFITKT